jgi:hypothetical protein
MLLKVHQPAIKKLKLLRSNPTRFTLIRFQGTNPYEAPDDEYLCSSTSRRPKIVHDQINTDEELSDYVTDRLLIARVLALKRYREIYKPDEQA